MANCLQLHRAGLDDVSRVFTQSVIGVGVSTVLGGDGSSCGGLPQLTREFLLGFFFFFSFFQGRGSWWERRRVQPSAAAWLQSAAWTSVNSRHLWLCVSPVVRRYWIRWKGVTGSGLPLYLYTCRAAGLLKTIASKKGEKKSLSVSDVMSDVTRISNPFHPSVGANMQHLNDSLHLPSIKSGGITGRSALMTSLFKVWEAVSISSWQTSEMAFQSHPIVSTYEGWGLGGGRGWLKVIRLIPIWHLSVSTEQPCLPLLATFLCADHIHSWRPAWPGSPSRVQMWN